MRKLLVRAVVVLAVLAGLYTAAGFFVLPRLIESRLSGYADRRLHAVLRVASLQVNPFLLEADARGLSLARPDGAILGRIAELHVRLDPAGLLQRQWRIANLRIVAPALHVARDAAGRSNWAQLLGARSAGSDPPLPPLLVDRATLSDGTIRYSDRSRGAPVSIEVKALSVRLDHLSTIKGMTAHGALSANLDGGGHLSWRGSGSIVPLRAHGSLSMTGLPLATPWRLLAPTARPLQGTLRLSTDMTWRSAPRELELSALAAHVSNIAYAPGGGTKLEVRQLALRNARVDLARRVASIAKIELSGPQARFVRGGSENLDLARMLDRARHPSGAARGASWHFEVKELVAHGGTVRYVDQTLKPAARVRLDDVAFSAGKFVWPMHRPLQAQASAKLAGGGTLAANGALSVAPLGAVLRLKADGLALAAAQPWLARYTPLRLAAGTASAQGWLTFDAQRRQGASLARFTGSAHIDALRAKLPASSAPLIAWRKLEARRLALTLAPDALKVHELIATAPQGRLVVEPDHSLSVARLFHRAHAAAASQPFAASVARLRIAGGTLQFADLSAKPQFHARIERLGGVVDGLSTRRGATAHVHLNGQVNRYASAHVRGTLELVAPQSRTDVRLKFKNLDMHHLNPYIQRFAGYKVASGKLSVTLRYRIRKGELNGDSRIAIERLKFGAPVHSPDAIHAPIRLALALLTGPNGVAHLDIPVHGDLRNPAFSYGDLIWKALGGVLARVASTPFRLLASLVGSTSTGLKTVSFRPGSARLRPPQREPLDRLARALARRPRLDVVVHARYASNADARALRRRALRAALSERTGQSGPIDYADARIQQALTARFVERFGSDAANALAARVGKAHRGESGAQRARELARREARRIAASMPLAEGALADLAQRRGQAIRAALLADGIDKDRISSAAPVKAGPSEGLRARLALVAAGG